MTGSGNAGRAGLRPLAAALVVVVFAVVVVVVVARLPGSTSTAGPSTTTTTSPPATGNAAVDVEMEIPATTTTTTVAGATTTTTAASHATTTTAAPTTTVYDALRSADYDIVGEDVELTPPTATSIEYTPGHETDADQVAELLGLSSTAVVAFHGSTTGLPVGTDLVVVVGKAA